MNFDEFEQATKEAITEIKIELRNADEIYKREQTDDNLKHRNNVFNRLVAIQECFEILREVE